MKKTNLPAAIALAGLTLGLYGCDVSIGIDSKPTETANVQQAPAPAATTITLKEQTVNLSHTLEGFVKASQSVDLRPQVGGALASIAFKEGSQVVQGQPLFRINDALIKAEMATAKAALAQANAEGRSATREADRARDLNRVNAISDEAYERAITAQEVSQAAIQQAEANVERQQVLLDYATINAPFAGTIGRAQFDEGALLMANQTQPLARLQAVNELHVDVMLDSARYLAIQNSLKEPSIQRLSGAPVTLTLEDGSVYPHTAKVLFTESELSQQTSSYLMRLSVDNPNGLLLPGMYVRAEVIYGGDEGALLVPEKAVQRTPKGETYVMIVNDEGNAETRNIVTAQLIDQSWRVLEGLAEGDRVIVNGLQKVSPGSPVNASDASDDQGA